MREDIEQLLTLQELDRQISGLTVDLALIPRRKTAANARLSDDQATLNAAKKTFQDNEIATKSLELDIGTRRNTVEKLNTQRFETKKNDEYHRLGDEIRRYEAEIDDLETNELELLELADDYHAAVKLASAALAERKVSVDKEVAILDREAGEKAARKSELEEQRKDAARPVADSLLADYERLFAKHGGNAVNQVTPEKSCTGCHVKVIPSTFAAAKSGERLAECDNCGAFLYYSSPSYTEDY